MTAYLKRRMVECVVTDNRQTLEDKLPSEPAEFQPGDEFALHALRVDDQYISNKGAWIVLEGYWREGRIIPYLIHTQSYLSHVPMMSREGALRFMRARARKMTEEQKKEEVLCFVEGRRYGQ